MTKTRNDALYDLQIPWSTKRINPILVADKIHFIQAMERQATVEQISSSIDAIDLSCEQKAALWEQTGALCSAVNQTLENFNDNPATKATVDKYGCFDIHAMELALMAMLDETRRVASRLIPQELREDKEEERI
jgi:hypothetical protein